MPATASPRQRIGVELPPENDQTEEASMPEPISPTTDHPIEMWKVWCAVAAVTVILVGGSAVFIQLKFNTAPTSSAGTAKG
jgi:hypothetical protein